ncbi:NELlike 1 (Silurana), partial [Caligus rogercresseyi]
MEEKGVLPSLITKGKIVFNPKEGNGTDISHWRSITILNESYCILAGVVAVNLEP